MATKPKKLKLCGALKLRFTGGFLGDVREIMLGNVNLAEFLAKEYEIMSEWPNQYLAPSNKNLVATITIEVTEKPLDRAADKK